MPTAEIKRGWNAHKKIVITGAQIITILTLVAGIWTNHLSNSSNETALTNQNQWMKDAIREQRGKIEILEVKVAVLESEVTDAKQDIRDLENHK
jgi:hypothetical protein